MTAMICYGSLVHAQIRDTNRVYDVVTDDDSFYLFPSFKPCFTPGVYHWAPVRVMLQEYVATDTVTVYGVAVTVENRYGTLDANNPNYNTEYRALLMNRVGPSPTNNQAFSMEQIDTVSLFRSHPRFCWFRYEDDCDKEKYLVAPCYEFYFDTPEQINRIVDTFYVGRYRNTAGIDWCVLEEYGGEYSSTLPSTIYQSQFYGGMWFDLFYHCVGYQDRKWGVAFPIIGFRCGPIQRYWLDSYTGDSAVVSWRSVEEGTLYNVRLVGNDGSDTTYVTADTTIALTQLSDSVRYNVMLRKQCHYSTSNYDTTVYGSWLSYISFGIDTTGSSNGGGSGSVDTTVSDTTGIVQPRDEDFVLMPNPAQGRVQVVMPSEALGGLLTLCDLSGRELSAFDIVATLMDIDISKLPAGVYFAKISTGHKVITRRLLVE